MVRLLGLDVGSKTIGVALSDELGLAAHPLTTIARRGTAKDVERVAALAREHGAERVVVGMPLEGDGTEARRAERVRVFMRALGARGIPVAECDERFSTVEAEQTLLEANLSRRRRKQVIDRVAAAVILERWLKGEH